MRLTSVLLGLRGGEREAGATAALPQRQMFQQVNLLNKLTAK